MFFYRFVEKKEWIVILFALHFFSRNQRMTTRKRKLDSDSLDSQDSMDSKTTDTKEIPLPTYRYPGHERFANLSLYDKEKQNVIKTSFDLVQRHFPVLRKSLDADPTTMELILVFSIHIISAALWMADHKDTCSTCLTCSKSKSKPCFSIPQMSVLDFFGIGSNSSEWPSLLSMIKTYKNASNIAHEFKQRENRDLKVAGVIAMHHLEKLAPGLFPSVLQLVESL